MMNGVAFKMFGRLGIFGRGVVFRPSSFCSVFSFSYVSPHEHTLINYAQDIFYPIFDWKKGMDHSHTPSDIKFHIYLFASDLKV